MNVLKDNSFNVRAGTPHFNLHTNRCDYFEIGRREGDDVWLEGVIVDGGNEPEFIFNGRLFCKKGGQATIIDGFPKTNEPDGWSKAQSLDGSGYTLRDADGEIVFGYSIKDGLICDVEVGLHSANGEVAAIAGQGGLVTNISPVAIGRGGIAFG